MTLFVFLLTMLVFTTVGLASATRSRHTKGDYYLASRDVSPALVGLSAIATNNSGYMFIGLMGFTYSLGFASLWLMVGWILGDFLTSFFVHRRLREASVRCQEITFSGTLAAWANPKFTWLRRAGAFITLLFLGAYAAAQFKSGGKALHAILHWQPETGALIVAILVALYCLAGGIRASIWTDAAQSMVMMGAMGVLFSTAINAVGGLQGAWSGWQNIPGFLDPFPASMGGPVWVSGVLFIVGWLFAGMGTIGQPHIMVRFMTLDTPRHLLQARLWYYGFYVLFYGLAAGVGLFSRLILPELSTLDPELALPTMAREMLHPAGVGLVLAGIFAATMSTADSLVLSCSAAITHDLWPQRFEHPSQLKVVTIAVVLAALFLAWMGPSSVFALVIFAWSALASAFGPLLWVLARGHTVGEREALLMMCSGLTVALLWRYTGWQDVIYEGLPGMLAGWLVFCLSRWTGEKAEKNA